MFGIIIAIVSSITGFIFLIAVKLTAILVPVLKAKAKKKAVEIIIDEGKNKIN